jgi:hypothetical protein
VRQDPTGFLDSAAIGPIQSVEAASHKILTDPVPIQLFEIKILSVLNASHGAFQEYPETALKKKSDGVSEKCLEGIDVKVLPLLIFFSRQCAVTYEKRLHFRGVTFNRCGQHVFLRVAEKFRIATEIIRRETVQPMTGHHMVTQILVRQITGILDGV